MKKFSALLFSIAVLGLTGCGTPEPVTTYTNPISGRRTDIMGANLLDNGEQNPREMIWLNAYRDFEDKVKFKYYLEIIYGANKETGYLDIGPGRSLTIIADGDELHFVSLGSLDKKVEKNVVYESARYEATGEDMKTISNASKVTVKVAGKNGLLVREFGPENFENFRKFVQTTTGGL